MLIAIIIAVVTCVAFILNILFKPSVTAAGKTFSIYWIPPLIGAVAMLIFNVMSPKQLFEGLTADSEINPIKILTLFLSLTLMSVLLDSAGFFRLLASKALSVAKHSQWALFICLYLTVSVLTVFTSNDIIVLTFTPFICYFAHNAKIDPIPYLIGEFAAANTWSMALIIGNPTNIYLASSANITFAEYLKVMILPTMFAGAVSLCLLLLLFRKKLKNPLCPTDNDTPNYDRILIVIGALHLAACIILMAISSYIGLPMWLISLCCFISQYLCSIIYCIARRKFYYVKESFRRTPVVTVPFVMAMFTIVLALVNTGATATVTNFLQSGNGLIKSGISSFVCSNLLNNIPMSVLFSALADGKRELVFSAIIGSNLGALLTPVGALAGIMWTGMLKNHGVKLSFVNFIKYGAAVSIPSLASALLGLTFTI